MGIIHRYILKEISLPFLMILCVLTFVLLMGRILQLMDLMVNKGVGIIDVAMLILYMIPSFLVFTIPISLLISILIGLGRLSGDNEITIFKASGISIYKLIQPIAIASLIAFILTAFTSLFLVPQGNQRTRNVLFTIAQKKASIGIKEKIFNDDFRGILLYAEKIPSEGNYMEGVIVSDNRLGEDPSTIIAKRAYLVSDDRSMTVTLRLENGSTHMVSGDYKNYRKMDFRFYDINLNIESPLNEAQRVRIKKPSEMTVLELIENIKKQKTGDLSYREMAIELNKKLTIPISCIVFGIIGIPLGIKPSRSVKSRGFVIGIFTVLIYYLAQITGDALVETGKLPVFIGTWAPNMLFGIVGAYLLVRSADEKPLTVRLPDSLKSLFHKNQ
ncbi:MAG: LPS export ABC transporter permease LptF [Deltaproteobacteria bacterium]|nr:LPS export ABC transporter permease LptF [Deltaproteobacteria bacterium]